MSSSLLARVRALLNLPSRMETQLNRLRKDVDESLADVRRTLEAHQEHTDGLWRKQKARHADLGHELSETRAELKERLLQHQLQLSRVTALLDNGSGQAISTHQVPLAVSSPTPASPPPVTKWEWLTFDRCPGCGTADRTIVCEWNKSILLDQDIPEDSMRYDYALCHGCGMVYATRRPVGATYRALMDDFPDTIGRDAGANASDGLLNPYPLSEADRQRYRELMAGGVFVSDHAPQAHIVGVLRDRLENSGHVEILAGLLDLREARVLEVRSRAGTIATGLRRQFGASVVAMPIFESQQLILRELCGIECSEVIDYDMFTIPIEGQFDLIACNHMLTHIVRPDRFFDQIRQHMKIGGHLYLYNEMDEGEFLARGKSIINSLNAIHLQAFDRASLTRLLAANGFEVTFIKWESDQLCLATFTGSRAWSPMPPEERRRRVHAYALARARAILRAPEAVRGRFSAVWEEALSQAVAAGFARFDDKGRLRLVKDK